MKYPVWLGAEGYRFHYVPLFSCSQDGSLQCPTCKTIYGVKTGTQPPGKMEYHIIPHALPGHSDCKTIRIIYNIPPGVQVWPGPMPRGVHGWSPTGAGGPCHHCVTPGSYCSSCLDSGLWVQRCPGSCMSVRMLWEVCSISAWKCWPCLLGGIKDHCAVVWPPSTAVSSSASMEAGGVTLCPEHSSELQKGFVHLPLLTLQGPEHPNPGKSFTARGFPRHCYLPDSEKGRKVRGSPGWLELAKARSRVYRGGEGANSYLEHVEKQTGLMQANLSGAFSRSLSGMLSKSLAIFPCAGGALQPRPLPGRAWLWVAHIAGAYQDGQVCPEQKWVLPDPSPLSTGTEVAAGSMGPALDLRHWDFQHHRRVRHGDLE